MKSTKGLIVTTPEPFAIYRFGSVTDGDAAMADLLGGKGAFLAGMSKLDVPVPPGFTLPCPLSIAYLSDEADTAPLLSNLIAQGEQYLEEEFGFQPLVSVRSGSRKSMPGMMDTILNVGITSQNFPEWEERLGRRCALDSRRRLIQMYASVAMGVPLERFESALEAIKKSAAAASDKDLNEDQLARLIEKYLGIVVEDGLEFPDTREEQIMGAVLAVFNSWDNERAADYRQLNNIPYDWGTSATVQAMVFGNFDEQSCSGVAFSRNPATGVAELFVDWVPVAQGEDVVAGIRDTFNVGDLAAWSHEVFADLSSIAERLEAEYQDMQDIEFTVQSGKLFILQCRRGMRAASAAFQIAYDLCSEGVITKEQALTRVDQAQLFAAMTSRVDPLFKKAPLLTGLGAGGTVVTGVVVFSAADAISCTEPCILVRKETDPDDFSGMAAAVGILTATGGATSHAAVVARGMNKACVVGATDLSFTISAVNSKSVIVEASAKGATILPGQKISIDGSTGKVWLGSVPIISGVGTEAMRALCSWSVQYSGVAERLEVFGPAPEADIQKAVGAITLPHVYIDLAALELCGATTDQCREALISIGETLALYDFTSVVIDMRALRDYRKPCDTVLDKMLGGTSLPDSLWVAEALSKWPQDVKDISYVKNGNMVGFRKFAMVANFADLLSAEGPVEITKWALTNSFGGDEAYQQALKLVESSKGVQFFSVTPSYWYGFLGSKS